MIMGEKILLRELDPANADIARRWINDPAVNEWLLTGHIPLTSAAEKAFYDRVEASPHDHVFEIHVTDTGRYIGNCGLHGVDFVHRHAEIGILIGDVAEQGRGYGRDALVTICRFGFDTLGLHRLEIRYIAGNERAAHLYPSIGFTPAGVLREHLFIRGTFRDEVQLEMLDREFRERYPR